MNEHAAHRPELITGDAGLLGDILQLVPHGICVFGRDRRVTMFNAAYVAIMTDAPVAIGESLDEIVERRLAAGEYGSGEFAERYADKVRYPDGTPHLRRRRRPNGVYVEAHTMPLPNGGHMDVVSDVTALMKAETELSRRAETMNLMLANIRHGIVLWDAEGRVVACNAVAEEMLSAPPGFLQPGRTLDETIESALERGNLGTGEVAARRARFLTEQDRSQSHADQRLTRLGRVIEVRSDPTPGGGFVTTYTDVTSMREAEVALRQATATAEAASAGKSRFLAAMSHELRTPLATILDESEGVARAAADLMARASGRSPPENPEAAGIRNAARAVHTAGRTLLSLVDSILDVTRLEAGRIDLAEDRLDPVQLIRACVRHSDPAAAAAEVALVAAPSPDLPRILGDERRLRQALNHLVVNAVRFTDAMGSVSLEAHLDGATGDLWIDVVDTGVGIPDADLERVFEPFVRLDDGRGVKGGRPAGAGLGLYVSRALMRAHGGDVILQSRAGHGTRARMLVPASRVLHLDSDVPI